MDLEKLKDLLNHVVCMDFNDQDCKTRVVAVEVDWESLEKDT